MTPRQLERTFPPSYAKTLLNISKGDLLSAKALSTHQGVRVENAFYLAQQSIEKNLKAVLVHCEVAVPLIHDLGGLIAKLPDDIMQPKHGYELAELNQFATIRRYEEGEWTPQENELERVLVIAQDMIDWAEKIICR